MSSGSILQEPLGISDANVGVWMEMDEIAKMSDKVLLGSDLFMEFPFTFEARVEFPPIIHADSLIYCTFFFFRFESG